MQVASSFWDLLFLQHGHFLWLRLQQLHEDRKTVSVLGALAQRNRKVLKKPAAAPHRRQCRCAVAKLHWLLYRRA